MELQKARVAAQATEINVEFVSASLRMVVTPQITAEGTVIRAGTSTHVTLKPGESLAIASLREHEERVHVIGSIVPANTRPGPGQVCISEDGADFG